MLDALDGHFTNKSDVIARVVLHGYLRRKFGPEYTIAASTSARAVAVLCIMKPGFRAALMEGEYRVVRGPMKGGMDLDERMLGLRLPPSGEMHIWPVAKGRKRGGVGKVIIGAVLVVAAVVLAIPTGGGSLAFGTSVFGAGLLSGITAGSVALFGASMILGGITQMLSPQPRGTTQTDAAKAVDAAQSFLLGGQLNVAQQGIPVPVPYGRTMVGSVVVSVGYEAAEWVAAGAVSTPGPGGSPPTDDFGTNFMVANKTVGGGVQKTGAGGGGKSGGGSSTQSAPAHTPVEAPNTLRSRAIVRLIDVLGEGPIGGLVGGAQGIFFNGTPLQAADGSFNFNGIGWVQRFGYPDQLPVAGFPASEETISLGTQLRQSVGPITQTVTSATANGLRITLRVASLFDTDTANGDINPSEIAFMVEVRPSRVGSAPFVGSYLMMLNTSIQGKCTSPYERSYRLELPGRDQGANTWDVRVTRLTPDSTRLSLANDLFFGALSVVTDHALMYPDTAYVALLIDAELFGSNIPTRTYLIDGLQVAVPMNYDANLHTYSSGGQGTIGGTWDTISFKNATTSNPAWILYDMLSNSRYGCGIPGQHTETTRADLYVISQYCDGQVPDGYGGSELRYRVDAVITEQVEAYVMLQTMVSAFRGMTHWGAGQVLVTADMPKNPLKLVNQSNVIDGDFDYQGTSLKTRHNLARVTYRDWQKQYTPTVEVVEMTADIAKRGVIATDIVAWGCVTRSLAHRLGKWLLFTENQQVETVQYDAGIYHLDLRPGDVFQQEDPLYFGLRYGGRLRGESTQNVVHLDTVVQLTGAQSYTFTVVMPDNTVSGFNGNVGPGNFSISPDGTHSIIILNPNATLPEQPMPNAEWILLDSGTVPRLFQTVSVAQPSPGRYQVTAVQHNPGKFDFIEFGIAFPEQVFSHLPELVLAALAPPSDVAAIDYMVGVGSTQILRVTVSWTPPADLRVDHFQVLAQGTSFAQIYEADGASKDIDGLVPGVYSFAVRSVGRRGQVSVWVSTSDVVVDGKVDPPAAPIGFTVVGGTRRIMLNWIQVARRDIKHYEIQRAPYLNGAPTSYAPIAFIGGSSFIDGQSDVLLPHTRWFYRIRAITQTDVAGFFSLDEWAETTLLITDDLEDGIINTAKFAHSLAVPTLSDTVPVGPPQTGDSGMVFVTTTGQLYLWNGTAWHSIADQVASATTLVPAANITGQLTNAQILSLAAAKLTGQITNTQILDGTISTPELSAGAVTTAKIAAGAVTTESLAVGSASNVIWNSCLEQSYDGWQFASTIGFWPGEVGTVKGSAYEGPWRLQGMGTGYMHAAGGIFGPSAYMVAAWDPNHTDPGGPIGVPFPPNTPIEAQALLIGIHLAARVKIDFYTDANAVFYISSLIGTVVTNEPPSGQYLSNYKLSWAHGISPPNCQMARFSVIGFDGGTTVSPQSVPGYIFFTQCSLGVSVANATQPQAWQPGGVTTISGGLIKTRTIQAIQIAAQAIGATEIAANAIIAGKIATNAVIAGTIQAAAVGASEIAAGQIRATHLAADFVLASNAQFGTAVIDTAQIRDLSVGTGKIAANAVSVLSFVSAYQAQDVGVVITTDGSPVMMFVQYSQGLWLDPDTGQGVLGDFVFVRDTTLLAQGSIAVDGQTGKITYGFGQNMVDFPPPGNHSYSIHYDVSRLQSGHNSPPASWAAGYRANAGTTQILLLTVKR